MCCEYTVRAPRVCFYSVYFDMHYDKISLNFIAGSVCLCGRHWSVCVVLLVSYVVVAVTVVRLMLFVLDGIILKECEGDGIVRKRT